MAYLSRRKHFLVEMVRSPLENGASWRFKRLLLMKWLVFHGKLSPISITQSERDSNLLGSNVVLGKPHPSHFEDAEMKHTYLDERSTTITKVVPPGRGCSIALKEWLTPAISPNVGNSTSSFLLVGICVRANPFDLNLSFYTHLLGIHTAHNLAWAVPF